MRILSVDQKRRIMTTLENEEFDGNVRIDTVNSDK